MDIDKPLSDADEDYGEPEDDDDDEREAPSEKDTDEAEVDVESEGGDYGHIEPTPRDYGGSPLQAKVLDFGSKSEDSRRQVSPLAAQQPGDDRDSDEHSEDEHEEDEHHEDDHDGDHERAEQERTDAERDEEFDRVLSEAYHDRDRQEDVQEDDDPHKSEGSSPSVPPDSEDDSPPPIPQRSKRSASRLSPKDRQSRRIKRREPEPAISESLLEDKIASILCKTLPTMLTGMLQEAMGAVRIQPSPTPPPLSTAVHVAVGPSEPASTTERVDPSTNEVGVQGMDVEQVDEATAMDELPIAADSPNTGITNVSIHSPCDSVF